MFKRDVHNIKELILKNLRTQGLETPLLQKRLIDSWAEIAGDTVAKYTDELMIKNQTLHVHLTNPALRANLSMSSFYTRKNAGEKHPDD